MRRQVISSAVFMLVACGSIACGTSYQTRVTPTPTEEPQRASELLPASVEIGQRKTAPNLVGWLGLIVTHQTTRAPELTTTGPAGIRLPKPRIVSANASALTGVAANTAYYSISALETGANLAVAAGSSVAVALEAMPQFLEATFIRASSFVILHQLLRYAPLPSPQVEGATHRYELAYDGSSVRLDWTLIRRHPQGDVWSLEVSGSNSYSIRGWVRSTDSSTLTYRVDLLGSITDAASEEFWSPSSGRYIEIESPDPMGDPLQIPALLSARETLCRLGRVAGLTVTTGHDAEPLRLTYLCGYGKPELVQIEQTDVDGRSAAHIRFLGP